ARGDGGQRRPGRVRPRLAALDDPRHLPVPALGQQRLHLPGVAAGHHHQDLIHPRCRLEGRHAPLDQRRPAQGEQLLRRARAQPVLRGWLHAVWFGTSLATGPLLVFRRHGAGTVAALAVYAVSVSALFGISALYHRGTWSPPWSVRLQRMDHLMIFFLIAGTATPAFLLAMPGPFGLTCLIVMWTLTGAAAIIHLCWMSAPEALVG